MIASYTRKTRATQVRALTVHPKPDDLAGGTPRVPRQPVRLKPPASHAAVTAPPVAQLRSAPLPGATPGLVSRPQAQSQAAPGTAQGESRRFTEPQLVHRAALAVPPAIAHGIRAEIQLDVSVSIDAAGRVTSARVVSSRGEAAGLLAIEALKAAQRCRFQPAERDGRAVAGSIIVTFRLVPRPP